MGMIEVMKKSVSLFSGSRRLYSEAEDGTKMGRKVVIVSRARWKICPARWGVNDAQQQNYTGVSNSIDNTDELNNADVLHNAGVLDNTGVPDNTREKEIKMGRLCPLLSPMSSIQ
jgi:hypothetical protein